MGVELFLNYGGLIKIARCGFPWKKTTKRPIAPVYTNCETALAGENAADELPSNFGSIAFNRENCHSGVSF
jgi:hypothetical protein